jgi:predicted transcriptional regulator
MNSGLEWRRSKVQELSSRGYNQSEISRILQVSTALIGTDVQYLRSKAKENLKEYTTQHLPEQYQVCLAALDTILKNAFVIMQKTEDNREKLAAMELFKDTHLTKLDLLSNATTIDSALEFIRSKQSQQEQHKKGQALDSTNNESISNPITSTTAEGKQSVF